MAAVDSPRDQNKILEEHKESIGNVNDFQFDSREESFAAGVEFQNDEEGENKMYDMIISKVLSNPRIDKRTLL